MKNRLTIIAIICILIFGIWYGVKAPTTPLAQVSTLAVSRNYTNTRFGFSLTVPTYSKVPSQDGFLINEAYTYQLIPGETIVGVNFTIPISLREGTNLSEDSYISFETIPNVKQCTADIFLSNSTKTTTEKDGTTLYSVASSSEAAAGNRYEEIVYALEKNNKCIAIRYFVHYGVFENYPAGTIREFDKQKLFSSFDAIRRSLVLQ